MDVVSFLFKKSDLLSWLIETSNCSNLIQKEKLHIFSIGKISDSLYLNISKELDKFKFNSSNLTLKRNIMGTLLTPINFLSKELDYSNIDEDEDSWKSLDSLTLEELELIDNPQKTLLEKIQDSSYSSEIPSLMVVWK